MFIAALFAVVSFSVDAQQRGRKGHEKIDPEKKAKRGAERLAEQLDLSEEQKSQVYSIHLDRAIAKEKAQKQRREEAIERRTAIQTDRNEHQAEVEKVLTPEQRQQWVEIKNEERNRRDQYRGARGNKDGERIKKHRESRGKRSQKK